MFLLKRLSGALSKYLFIALLATSASTATFAWLYKEALQDVARVRAEEQRAAAVAANNRASEVAVRLQAALEERERVLLERIRDASRVAREADERRAVAERVLSDYETERLSAAEADPEERAWSETKLPSGVVTRLQELADHE